MVLCLADFVAIPPGHTQKEAGVVALDIRIRFEKIPVPAKLRGIVTTLKLTTFPLMYVGSGPLPSDSPECFPTMSPNGISIQFQFVLF